MKIGVMFGSPETTTGGNALKFYASVRLDVRKVETLSKGDDEAWGNRVKVKVVKNKMAPPFRKAELEILFGKGISAFSSLLDCAVKYDIIEKSGSWYAFENDKIGQGKNNAVEFLEKNLDITLNVEKKLREKLFPGRPYVSSFVNVEDKDEVQMKEAFKAMAQDGGVPSQKRKKALEIENEEKPVNLF